MPGMIGNVIVLAILGAVVFFAVRSLRKQHKSGGCCGDCSKCKGCH